MSVKWAPWSILSSSSPSFSASKYDILVQGDVLNVLIEPEVANIICVLTQHRLEPDKRRPHKKHKVIPDGLGDEEEEEKGNGEPRSGIETEAGVALQTVCCAHCECGHIVSIPK